MKKKLKILLFIYLILFGVILFLNKGNIRESIFSTAIIGMLGVFYVVIPYFFFEKSERVNRIKKEVLNAKHNAFVKKNEKRP